MAGRKREREEGMNEGGRKDEGRKEGTMTKTGCCTPTVVAEMR
jgi:hypothetical protein